MDRPHHRVGVRGEKAEQLAVAVNRVCLHATRAGPGSLDSGENNERTLLREREPSHDLRLRIRRHMVVLARPAMRRNMADLPLNPAVTQAIYASGGGARTRFAVRSAVRAQCNRLASMPRL
jgi:hypothetical protein